MTTDINAVGPAGRTEAIIPLVRKTFGDDMVLYADSNGFYSVEEAIRVGKLLEEYRFQFFEEPVPFDWYEETQTGSRCAYNSLLQEVNRNTVFMDSAG